MCAPLFTPVNLREGAQVTLSEHDNAPELCNPRRGYLSLQIPGAVQLQSHQDCPHNEKRSLATRVLREVPEPTPEALDLLAQACDELAERLITVVPLTLEQFIEVVPKHKRKAYRKALVELEHRGLMRKDTMVSAFVKHEKLRLEEKEGDPRMIQFRSMVFNCFYGRFTRAVEKQLYKIKINGKRVIFKGLNERQRAELLKDVWDQYDNPRALMMDASRWDMHCHKKFLKNTLHRLMLKICPFSAFRRLAKKTLKNTGFTSGGHRYKLKGSVMSGDMTTALGNCIAMICCIYALAKKLGLHKKLRIICDGDDSGIIGELEDVLLFMQHAEAWFRDCGHEIKLEKFVDAFEDIEFCQHHPIYAAGAWRMMPDPRKVIASSLMVPKGKIPEYENYLAQVWWARAILHQGMPVIGPLFRRLAQRYPKPENWDVSLYTSLMGEKLGRETRKDVFVRHVTREARATCSRIWGIEPDEQLALEQLRVPPIPEVVETRELIQTSVGQMEVHSTTKPLSEIVHMRALGG